MIKTAKNPKRILWLISAIIILPIILFSIVLISLYAKQDTIIQAQIASLNKGHKGMVVAGKTHLSPFQNFPYISIKVDEIRVSESKAKDAPIILDVADIYIGFDLWDIVTGDYDIQTLLIEEGFFNLVLHKDGTNNLQNALFRFSFHDME